MSENLSSPPNTPTATAETLQVERDFAGRQYIGQRKKQEDYYAFSDISKKSDAALSRMLIGLGDGLGAHIGGNLASYFIVTEFIKAYKRSTLDAAWRLRVALETANEHLYKLSHRVAWDRPPMGSTFVGVTVDMETMNCHWISVGDSPLFIFREGQLLRINADHSLAPLIDDRVRAGEITKEEGAVHPDRHVLQSACMGLPLTMVDVRMEPYPLQKGDIIVAASDGILSLDHKHLEQLIQFGRNATAGKLADALIFAIRCADLPRQDNATVAILKMPPIESKDNGKETKLPTLGKRKKSAPKDS